MITRLLLLLLRLLNSEGLRGAVARVEEEYTDAMVAASVRRVKGLDTAESLADRAAEAYGAVLFVAGQHLSIVQHVKSEVARARRGE